MNERLADRYLPDVPPGEKPIIPRPYQRNWRADLQEAAYIAGVLGAACGLGWVFDLNEKQFVLMFLCTGTGYLLGMLTEKHNANRKSDATPPKQ